MIYSNNLILKYCFSWAYDAWARSSRWEEKKGNLWEGTPYSIVFEQIWNSVLSVTRNFVQNCDQVQYLTRAGRSKSLLGMKCVDTE